MQLRCMALSVGSWESQLSQSRADSAIAGAKEKVPCCQSTLLGDKDTSVDQ